MDCRTTSAHKFRTRSGFKQNDVILTKEQSVLTRIMSSFEEKICKHNIMLYVTWLCFHSYKLVIEIHENGHSDKNIDNEIKRQKAIEQEADCKFIRIDPDKK